MSLMSLPKYVAQHIRNRIIKGQLQPGQRIKEQDISSELDVSTPPCREALKILEAEGLVELIPRRGAIVANITIKDIWEVYTILSALYARGVELAMENISVEYFQEIENIIRSMEECCHKDPPDIEKYIRFHDKFHDVLIRMSNNDRLSRICSGLRNQINRYSRHSYTNSLNLFSSCKRHVAVFEALKANNVEVARQLAHDHVIAGLNDLLNILPHGDEELEYYSKRISAKVNEIDHEFQTVSI